MGLFSSASKAQKLANKANIAIAEATNRTNKEIAAEQNAINYKMFQEQNTWNLEQWNRENEYNSPSAQMERYLQAGINPIWAMSDPSSGNAQQLTSATPAPAAGYTAVGAHVNPEYDSTPIQNFLVASRDVVNSLQGFQKLALESQDVDTRRSAQQSQEMLNKYDAFMKKALTSGYNIQNAFNTDTFGSRVGQQAEQLRIMQQKYENYKQEGKNASALYDNIVAGRDLIQAEISNFKSQVDYRVKQIQLQSRSLDIAQQNADTNSAQVSLQGDSLAFDKSKWQDQLQHWNNDEIYRWATSFATRNRSKGSLSAGLGSGSGVGISGSAEFEGTETFANFEVLEAANVQMFENCKNYPTSQNLDAYQRFDNYLKAILEEQGKKASVLPSSTIPVGATTVLNPSAPWNN